MRIERKVSHGRITRPAVIAYGALLDDPDDKEAMATLKREMKIAPWEFPADYLFAEDHERPPYLTDPVRSDALWWEESRELRRVLLEAAKSEGGNNG